MNTDTRKNTRDARLDADAPIPFTVTDMPIPYLVNDAPIPYRVRVGTASPALRAYMVPVLGIKGSTVPPEAESETRLRSVA